MVFLGPDQIQILSSADDNDDVVDDDDDVMCGQ